MAIGGAKGGSRNKRRAWAEETAKKLNEEFPGIPGKEAWLRIPESYEAWSIQAGEIDFEVEYEIYRDGDKLNAKDLNKKNKDGETPFITKSTFLKNYYLG